MRSSKLSAIVASHSIQLLHIHTQAQALSYLTVHFSSSSMLVACICAVSTYSNVRPETKQVLQSDCVFQAISWHRWTRTVIATHQRSLVDPAAGSPDVSAVPGTDLCVCVHMCVHTCVYICIRFWSTLDWRGRKSASERQQNYMIVS